MAKITNFHSFQKMEEIQVRIIKINNKKDEKIIFEIKFVSYDK